MRAVQLEIKMTTVGDTHRPEDIENIYVYVDGDDRTSVAASGIEKLFEALREINVLAEPVEMAHKVTYGVYGLCRRNDVASGEGEVGA
jgi:hypothetical protein